MSSSILASNNRVVLAAAMGGFAVVAWLMVRPVPMETHVHAMASSAAERPKTSSKILSCEPLADIPGKAVTSVLVSYPPNAFTPAHRHPGTVTAFVVKGVIRSQLGGGPAVDYTAGQTWFEPPGTLHVFAENPSATEPAELLATFVADENCGPLVIPEPSGHQHQ